MCCCKVNHNFECDYCYHLQIVQCCISLKFSFLYIPKAEFGVKGHHLCTLTLLSQKLVYSFCPNCLTASQGFRSHMKWFDGT